jgi:hypothetical protein
MFSGSKEIITLCLHEMGLHYTYCEETGVKHLIEGNKISLRKPNLTDIFTDSMQQRPS